VCKCGINQSVKWFVDVVALVLLFATYACCVGLRSGKVGEQCEAIVRYPELFEKYPFPILINSAFLKVADVFRVG